MEGEYVKPFLAFLPEIPSADRKISTKEKIIYSIISGWILIVSNILPLYGVHSTTGADPFYWIRHILTSNRGTTNELGIIPILVSRMVMQIFVCSKFIELDKDVPEDYNISNGSQKLLGILITVGAAVAYVLSGMCGSVNQLGTGNAILIVLQLCFATVIVIYLDELFQKGYSLMPSTWMFVCSNMSLVHIDEYPFFPMVYILFMIAACIFLWEMWIKVSCLLATDVAEPLLRNDVGSLPV